MKIDPETEISKKIDATLLIEAINKMYVPSLK